MHQFRPIPDDDHDRRLVAHTHPADHVPPPPRDRYHLVVVGAGTAGLVTAMGAVGLGANVALVERALTGGDCLNTGCVPSKALLRSARAAAAIRDAPASGIRGGTVTVDGAAVLERMRRLRADISRHDSVAKLTRAGVHVFLGSGRFTGRDAVDVEGTTLRFRRACIATGARAALPDVDGLADAGPLTNETLFSLTNLPARLAVIGGGPIGCEMGQCLARLGVEVVLVERGARLLGRDEPDAGALVEAALRRDGVDVRTNTALTRVERRGGVRHLTLECEGSASTVETDAILVAAGRAPNVEDLGLDAAGVAYDLRTGVTVDARLRTTNRRIYAAGDVCLAAKFTHTADATARIVIRNALFRGRRRHSDLAIPWCTYTEPEVAHVGLTRADAERRGVAIETQRIDFADLDRAVVDGVEDGFLAVHLRRGTDRIVGATMVGGPAGDVIALLSAAMDQGTGLRAFSDTVFPYPTYAEIVRKAADGRNRERLTDRARWLLGMMLKLVR